MRYQPAAFVASNLSAELHNSLHIVIKCINTIKVHSLNDRLFRALCHDNEKDFITYSSTMAFKSACMPCFYSFHDLVIEFLYGIDCQLAEAVKSLKNNIAYLADVFTFMNKVNKKLQGKMITLIRCKSVITSLTSKLFLYKENMGRNILSQFSNLCGNDVTEDELLKYYLHLHKLVEDIQIHFEDLVNLNVPCWVIQPFSAADLIVELHDQFIDLQNDDNFEEDRYDIFWYTASGKYSLIWNELRAWVLPFPTSYVVEKGFSVVTLLLSKQRNRLSISKRGILRLYLTKTSPNMKKLIEDHQAHPSH